MTCPRRPVPARPSITVPALPAGTIRRPNIAPIPGVNVANPRSWASVLTGHPPSQRPVLEAAKAARSVVTSESCCQTDAVLPPAATIVVPLPAPLVATAEIGCQTDPEPFEERGCQTIDPPKTNKGLQVKLPVQPVIREYFEVGSGYPIFEKIAPFRDIVLLAISRIKDSIPDEARDVREQIDAVAETLLNLLNPELAARS